MSKVMVLYFALFWNFGESRKPMLNAVVDDSATSVCSSSPDFLWMISVENTRFVGRRITVSPVRCVSKKEFIVVETEFGTEGEASK